MVDALKGPPQARENFGVPKPSLCRKSSKIHIFLLFTNHKFKNFGRCAAETLNILIR